MLSFPRKFLLRLGVCPHMHPHTAAYTQTLVLPFLFLGKYSPGTKVIYYGINAQPQTAELKIPKCLQLGPECRGRWPVVSNSYGVCKQLKSVSCPLSRFLLDFLEFFPGIHWKETSIMLMNDTNRNRRAHKSLQPPSLWGRRCVTSAAMDWYPVCKLFLPALWDTSPLPKISCGKRSCPGNIIGL